MHTTSSLGTVVVAGFVIAVGALAPACGSSSSGLNDNASDGGSDGAFLGNPGNPGNLGNPGNPPGGGGNGDGGPTKPGNPGTDGGAGGCSGGGTPGGGGPTGGPADLFPCDSPWYTDVTSAGVASDSAAIIGGIPKWGNGELEIDFSIIFQHATSATPTHTFTLSDTGDSDKTPVPVPPGGALEGETGYTCASGGDCHLIVVNDSTHQLFELWSVQSATGSFDAAQESVWDLTKHYGPTGRGTGCSSADAAGLAIMPGLIGLRETLAGSIKHALRFILPNANIRAGNKGAYVPPATHGTSSTKSSVGPAYGMHFRLHAGFDESKIASSGGKAMVRALKAYGMFLADGGNQAFTAENDVLEKQADPNMTWGNALSQNDLKVIQPTDFDVLDYTGPIQTGDNCTNFGP